MTKQQKIILGLIGLIIIAVLLWWKYGSPATQINSGEAVPVKIGGLFALTGDAAFAGEASRDGFLMAIEDSGLDTPYIIEDFQTSLKTVATAANKLINIDQVPVVIGPEWAEYSEIVVPLSQEKTTVFISPWMTSEGNVLSSPYYFSATPSERLQTRKLLEYIQNQGTKNFALIYSNNAWATGYVNVLKEELARTGLSITGEFKVNENTNDYRTEVSRIKAIQPQAVYTVISTDNDEGTFNKQLKESGLNVPHYMPYARAESQVFLKQFGQYAQGIIYPAPSEYKNMATFRDKYKARFGKEPGAISAATAYDMTTLVLQASKDGARTSEDIRQYLLQVKGYDGYSNNITFNEHGQVTEENVVLKKITSNEPEILTK